MLQLNLYSAKIVFKGGQPKKTALRTWPYFSPAGWLQNLGLFLIFYRFVDVIFDFLGKSALGALLDYKFYLYLIFFKCKHCVLYTSFKSYKVE